jgi:hypothetical protein
MATKRAIRKNTKSRAKPAAGAAPVRKRIRDMSMKEFRDRKLSLSDLPKLVNETLDRAVNGVDESIPKSRGNVLREVFDGLSEGVDAIAAAGSAAAGGVRKRAQAVASPEATRRVRAANREFLDAVRSFAGRTSGQVRDELDALVARAERTGPKVAGSARKVANAADGRLIELSGEAAHAGVRAARRAASALAMGASGLFEGLAGSMAPRSMPTPRKSSKTAPRASKKKAKKKAVKKRSKKS